MKTIKKPLDLWLNSLEIQHNKKIDLGLERISKVFSRLNLNPPATNTITVAGTNGKGSTVALLSSIARSAGLSTGEFTSPHILRFNERIKINGIEVSDEDIVSAFEKIAQHRGDISLSYFEHATLAALIVFNKYNVDLIILEVGLGGRLDSTNVVDADCAIITTIDIDHTEWLGDTIELIGREKAGIARPDKPLIFGATECPQSIVNYASQIKADLLLNGKTFQVNHKQDSFDYQFQNIQFQNLPKPNLSGEWQVQNAASAVTALLSLYASLITEESIRAGLLNAQLSARLEVIDENPEVIIDVSHNAQAIKNLSRWLLENPVSGKTVAVFGVLQDKHMSDWIHFLSPAIDVWMLSPVKCDRTMSRQELVKNLADHASLIMSFDSVDQAIGTAKEIAQDNDRVIIFGSFYTVSEALEALNKNSI